MISRNLITNQVQSGDRVTVCYQDKSFDVIVIDPNGLGDGKPTLGFGLTMMDKHAGLPQSTTSGWIIEGHRANTEKLLETPTGKTFEVIEILDSDQNLYYVLEISDWVSVAGEALKAKGKKQLKDSTKEKLINFLMWFAVKGFYAESYTALKTVYTDKDSRATTKWLNARYTGKQTRKEYTDLLQSQGCKDYDYAMWTDIVYEGLFGKNARQMKRIWECVDGSKTIARNYIPESTGLDAVQYCENMVVQTFIDDLETAHSMAIQLARKKYKLAEAQAEVFEGFGR